MPEGLDRCFGFAQTQNRRINVCSVRRRSEAVLPQGRLPFFLARVGCLVLLSGRGRSFFFLFGLRFKSQRNRNGVRLAAKTFGAPRQDAVHKISREPMPMGPSGDWFATGVEAVLHGFARRKISFDFIHFEQLARLIAPQLIAISWTRQPLLSTGCPHMLPQCSDGMLNKLSIPVMFLCRATFCRTFFL